MLGLAGLPRGHAEIDRYASATVRTIRGGYFPSAGLADMPDEREAKAMPRLAAAALETLEVSRRVVRAEARTSIAHDEALVFERHFDCAPLAMALGVIEQILQHQAEQADIRVDFGTRMNAQQRRLCPFGIRMQPRPCFMHGRRQIDWFYYRGTSFAGEQQQALRQRGSAISRRDDALGTAPCLIGQRRIG